MKAESILLPIITVMLFMAIFMYADNLDREPHKWYDEEGDTVYIINPNGGITPMIAEDGGYICRRCGDERSTKQIVL